MKLEQLLAFGDADFVREAYRSVLGREADEDGFTNYLDQVRSGTDKSALLVALAASPEGRERPVAVDGLAELLARHSAPRPHRLLRAVRRLMQPFRPEPLEPVLQRQRVLENQVYRLEHQLGEQLALLRSIEARLARVHDSQPAAASPAAPSRRPALPYERLAPPEADRHYRHLLSARLRRLFPNR